MDSRFGGVIERRRTYYSIRNESTLTDQELEDLLKHALKYTPTAHNTQLTRIVLLLMGAHDEFWDMVMDAIREANPGQEMEASEEKVSKFRDGYGTVLFYNDTRKTRESIEEMPLYAEQFEVWAQHANAMLQFSVWNMLEEAGMGASLQHYNPIVDERARKKFGIDPEWELVAQMPFGIAYGDPWDKTFEPIDTRFTIRD
jgi:predicted oxidoreductase (fatty acid repression mutant protein)